MTILFILINLKIISKEYNINRISLIKKFFYKVGTGSLKKAELKRNEPSLTKYSCLLI